MRTHRSCARRVRQCGTRPHLHPQTDIRMPRRQLLALEDAHLHSRFCEAIAAAVGAIEARDMDCRVLNLGAGAGLHAAAALRAGAVHVTAVERWLYLALACKEVLAANQVRRGGRGVGQVRGGRGRPSHVTRRAAPVSPPKPLSWLASCAHMLRLHDERTAGAAHTHKAHTTTQSGVGAGRSDWRSWARPASPPSAPRSGHALGLQQARKVKRGGRHLALGDLEPRARQGRLHVVLGVQVGARGLVCGGGRREGQMRCVG